MHADKILLNKVDLLKDATDDLAHIRSCISHVNKHAKLQETSYAKADLDFLLEKHSQSISPVAVADDHALSHEVMKQI